MLGLSTTDCRELLSISNGKAGEVVKLIEDATEENPPIRFQVDVT